MATADQIKALVKSHLGDERERFFSVVLQIAAHEALQRHKAFAQELREIVDREKLKSRSRIIDFPVDLQGLFLSEEPSETLSMMVIPPLLKERLLRIIHEYR